MEGVRVRQVKGDNTDNRGQRSTLLVSTDAESGETFDGKGKVVVARFMEPLHIPVAGILVNIGEDIFGIRRQKPFLGKLRNNIIFAE